MAEQPRGAVTFLFTDIEGSTRMWEADPETMQAELAIHDEVLRSAVDANGGHLFKHTGDGVAAVFGSARAAIQAAVDAQQGVTLPVRMGIVTGEAEERDGDYFGQTLNRVARVMSAAHAGQILVADSTAVLVEGVDLVDLGEHRLRDLSGSVHLHQVRAAGLESSFPPLKTLDATPGNLPAQLTSFVGRDLELETLGELVRANRLVTLTGAGGVGKTRLAVQAAAELTGEFPDGVWVVELAPVGDPTAVPDAVATTLGVTAKPGTTVTDSIAGSLSGRRLLIVLDNCEHVLDAAAGLVDSILRQATMVSVLATSREGLRLGAEQVWPVPSLDATAGPTAPAMQLFLQRAQAVRPDFTLDDVDEAAAVAETCQRLDGIALAIELAAARMSSMSAQELRDRLDDRFRLLSGTGRGQEHHQTLRRAVSWSYDLLSDDERRMLDRCSVFADGFDVAAATHISADAELDDLAALDLLDSLVRKSLVTTERISGHTRYGLLETIRQFGEDQLATAGSTDDVRSRHASYFASQAEASWARWNGPDLRLSLDWVDRELANLRTGFRWAASHGEVAIATSIAAHTTMLTFVLQRFEPIGWVEELMPAATAADLPQLPRLYTAGSVCALTGRPEVGISYAHTAQSLEADPRYEPFEHGWSHAWEAIGYRYTGRIDRWLEICEELADEGGLAHVIGLVLPLAVLSGMGRSEESRARADNAVAAARRLRHPFWIAFALGGYARAYADSDPALAMDLNHEALAYDREHRLLYFETNVTREIAGLEEVLGNPQQALELLDIAVEAYHRAGNHGSVATTLARVAVVFSHIDRPETAATIYGNSTRHGISMIADLPKMVEHLRDVLGNAAFDRLVEEGAALRFDDAMEYVRREIALAQRQLTDDA